MLPLRDIVSAIRRERIVGDTGLGLNLGGAKFVGPRDKVSYSSGDASPNPGGRDVIIEIVRDSSGTLRPVQVIPPEDDHK